MHYANGRKANNGDKVVLFTSYAAPVVGILYDAAAGNDYCNGKIAVIAPNDLCPNLKECVHFEDVVQALPAFYPADIPNTHNPAAPTASGDKEIS
jgi:hypothetical protein